MTQHLIVSTQFNLFFVPFLTKIKTVARFLGQYMLMYLFLSGEEKSQSLKKRDFHDFHRPENL